MSQPTQPAALTITAMPITAMPITTAASTTAAMPTTAAEPASATVRARAGDTDATASAIEPMRFDHVGLSVADLEVSRRFYGDVLGFRIEEDSFALPAHDIQGLVLVNAQGVRIELFQRVGSKPGRIGHPTEGALTHGYFQFALSVPDIAATFARVVAAGAKPLLTPRIAPDGRSLVAFVGDPDGNLVEFLQRPTAASQLPP